MLKEVRRLGVTDRLDIRPVLMDSSLICVIINLLISGGDINAETSIPRRLDGAYYEYG